jgi:hypothetical protein
MRGADPVPLNFSAKTLTGKTIKLTAHEGMTVGEVKYMIQKQECECRCSCGTLDMLIILLLLVLLLLLHGSELA